LVDSESDGVLRLREFLAGVEEDDEEDELETICDHESSETVDDEDDEHEELEEEDEFEVEGEEAEGDMQVQSSIKVCEQKCNRSNITQHESPT
jgi:hypothetical protein